MSKQNPRQLGSRFLIRPIRCECTDTQYSELCEAIEHLGGEKTEEGFAFSTAKARSLAAELLGDRFGRRYFELP